MYKPHTHLQIKKNKGHQSQHGAATAKPAPPSPGFRTGLGNHPPPPPAAAGAANGMNICRQDAISFTRLPFLFLPWVVVSTLKPKRKPEVAIRFSDHGRFMACFTSTGMSFPAATINCSRPVPSNLRIALRSLHRFQFSVLSTPFLCSAVQSSVCEGMH